MNFIQKMERKFHGRGIPNLTMYIIGCYVIGYILDLVNPSILNLMRLDPLYILQGQVWRLVTWILTPPDSFDIFTILMLFFYYSLGNTLERTWGSFRYTLYILSGLVFTILGAFLLFFVTGSRYSMGGMFTTYYICTSIFLAFAATYPNMQVLLYFVIPIKMKWMAYVYAATIAYDVIRYLRMGAWFMAVPILASILNFIIFFFGTRDWNRYNPKEVKRKRDFRKAMKPAGRASASSSGVTKHKCAICGRTEKDDPNLEFRFCSKCNGNYEYCQDHLFTHQHVK